MIPDGRFWRTVRYLKAQQLFGRLLFNLRRPVPDLRPPPQRRLLSGTWVMPARRAASLDGDGTLTFLGETRMLLDCGWDDPAIDLLWRYNAHYFDDLNARGGAERIDAQRHFVERWIVGNPPGHGTGWEPYPTSLRIVNWIKWLNGGEPPRAEWEHSLAVQARWLCKRMEFHLLGNHLFANAKALVFAGLYFGEAEAELWLREGVRILARELPEQILADGGQFELSPMYHALAFEDVLDLINVTNVVGSAVTARDTALTALALTLRARAPDMLFWHRCLLHGDGSMCLFNDAAEGVAPPSVELERYAAALGVVAPQPPREGVTRLVDSGYVRVARGDALALLDIGRVGPDYLPAHAHADTLSFELSLAGQRVLVNGGTSCYGLSSRRAFERGTAAHNTVEADGQNSSEVWGGFRVGRRARPLRTRIDAWRIEGAHDGYRYLPGGPVHRRLWNFHDRGLEVTDSLEPAVRHAVARFHLAPGLEFSRLSDTAWHILAAQRPVATVSIIRGTAKVAEATHAPSFGVVLAVQCLEVVLQDGRAETYWSWDDAA